ncbi:reverse transcriptase domain-containing protein [Tanacetum coccineum]
MHTRASNSELVEPLPKPERTLNRRLRRQNRRVPFDQRNNPPQQLRVVYAPILDINYFHHFLVTLQNLNPMDDKPMWTADRVVAPTPGSAITILETANEFAIKGRSNSDTDKIMARMDAMTMKMDAQYKEFQSRSKQPNLDNDNIPMSYTFMDLKNKVETTTKNHQASIQNLEAKFNRLVDKQSGRPSGSLPSNTQPNPKGSSSKPYQSSQARNEHVNAVFTRSGKSYDPPINPNDQPNDSETPIKFDIDNEDDEPTPQPKPKTPKMVKETPIPKPYKPKIPYPQRLRKEKMKARYGKFLDMIRAVRINVPLIDVLAGMPNYGKFLKELVNNKHKIEQILAAFLSNESSAILQNKVAPKLGDPGSFLIPCNFNKAFSCNALADLGASINLMPYSLYAKLSLKTLKPTKMSVRLADRSFQYHVGIAKNMLIEIGKFTFPADFVILKIEEDCKVPLILVRPFLHTVDALIQVKQKQLNLRVGTKRMIFHIDSAMKHSYSNDDTCFSIDVIDEILEEYFDALLDEGSEILHSIEGTILEEKLFAEFDEFMAMTADENSESEFDTEELPIEKITFNTNYKIKTSLEEPPTDLELKPLPDNLEYVFLEEPSFLHVGECMLSIFPDMIKESIEVFMDDFYVFGNSFDHCLNNHDKMLQHCKDAHLVLIWQKCHFMVKEEIVLGHKVSEASLEVDKAKIKVISKLPPPLISKDTPFEFNEECHNTFKLLKEKLTCALVIVSPNWNLPFELMCDASDFAVGAILEFDIEIKDRKGTKNVAVDHLSRIENDETSDDSEVDDNFPREALMEINTRNEQWFAYFANYLVSDIIPKGMTYQQKNIFFFDLKNYFWEEPYLFKVRSDGSLEAIPSSKETKFKCLQLLESKIEKKKRPKAEKDQCTPHLPFVRHTTHRVQEQRQLNEDCI